jgi:hypothetical protein
VTRPWHEKPNPPDGYYKFARHAANGWEMWVPPATAGSNDRLRAFQFRNNTHQIVVMSGPGACVSVSMAAVDDAAHEAYTSDVTNDYDGEQLKPRLPHFIALWCSYVASIAADLNVVQIQIGNVGNTRLGTMLNKYGFQELTTIHFTGMIGTVTPLLRAAVRDAGWTFD